ncbi:chorismate mutase/prephenate dehydratase [Desulfitispora alkaliphila]|uniref:chorismate mutase n=1 Tax=Desulfitispora alkaliphila TaxID=622674 RepID=UPI003D245D7D
MGLDKLEDLRKTIDEIDEKLVKLIEDRMDVVEKVARYKIENKMPVFDINREEEVIRKKIGRVKNKAYNKAIEDILTSIMTSSKNRQRKIIYSENQEVESIKKIDLNQGKVGYQGVRGSFGEQAMIKFFGEREDARAYDSFGDVLRAVVEKEVDYGVLPVENSSTGSINDVYDLIRTYDVHIIGEEVLNIQQNLLGVEGAEVEDIEFVYSHEQGFLQSSEFFKENPQMELMPCRNTALGAKHVMESGDRSKAAVASLRAAEIYGLKILKSNLNGNSNNSTRFAIIGGEPNYPQDADKISIVLTVAHEVGELQSILKIFSDRNLNLMKIESRPLQERPWEYFFYIDIEGNLGYPGIMDMMDEIKNRSNFFRVLGNYVKCSSRR